MFNTKPTASLEVITPEKAAELISKNDHNRTKSAGVVTKYANAMRQGKWQLNGDPIRIDKDGKLLDGQHRLQAIINSAKPQQMLIVKGLDSECFTTIDTGKNRSLADVLSIEGHSKYATFKASGLKMLWVLCKEREAAKYRGGLGGRVSLTHADGLIFGDKLPNYYSDADEAAKLNITRKLITGGSLATLYYLFGLTDKSKRTEFFMSLETGADLKPKSPVLILRNKLLALRTEGDLRAADTFPYVLSAWKSFRKDAEISYIKPLSDTSLSNVVSKTKADFLIELAKI